MGRGGGEVPKIFAQGHMLEKQGQAHLLLEPELNLGSDLEMVFLKLI